MKPSAREVAVMPNCAPDSWNERDLSSERVVRAARPTLGGQPLDTNPVYRQQGELDGHEHRIGRYQ